MHERQEKHEYMISLTKIKQQIKVILLITFILIISGYLSALSRTFTSFGHPKFLETAVSIAKKPETLVSNLPIAFAIFVTVHAPAK